MWPDASDGFVAMLCLQHPKCVLDTPAKYRTYLISEIFCVAMNNRFFKISRRNDPPFYNAGTQLEELAQPVQSSLLNATCQDGSVLRALEALLMVRTGSFRCTYTVLVLVRLATVMHNWWRAVSSTTHITGDVGCWVRKACSSCRCSAFNCASLFPGGGTSALVRLL